jgi:D-aminopeptidase
MKTWALTTLAVLLLGIISPGSGGRQNEARAPRPRARELGLTFGVLPTGPLNMITDVQGVKVGHLTLIEGDSLRTGITAVLPHGGNLFHEKVPGAVFVGNGFGKLAGSTQVNELGQIETPILLTNTLSVPQVADGLIAYMLSLPGMADVRSINPLVAETNDGRLNDIRRRPFTVEHVRAAIEAATAGPFATGCVGAGTGTVCFGFKGGIGTASRRLPESLGGWTVGVLVQTNFGGVLTINGVNVGRLLGDYPYKEQVEQDPGESLVERPVLDNNAMSPLFLAAVEATEEAIIDSLFTATTTSGRGGVTVEALPVDKLLEQLKRK